MADQSSVVQGILSEMVREQACVQGVDVNDLVTWLLTGEGLEAASRAINSVLDSYVNGIGPGSSS